MTMQIQRQQDLDRIGNPPSSFSPLPLTGRWKRIMECRQAGVNNLYTPTENWASALKRGERRPPLMAAKEAAGNQWRLAEISVPANGAAR
jgi:hypothetical protein